MKFVYVLTALVLLITPTNAAPYLGRATPNLYKGYTYRNPQGRIIGESRQGLGGQVRFYDSNRKPSGYIRGPVPKVYLPGVK
jgi:hypothetical protein